MRLKVPGEKIAELHPADLAEIISDLTRAESGKLLESLDVKTVADTLEEVEPDFQASLVETMPDEKVADVLEEMAPDEAADLLAELPEDRSQELLNLMEHEEAEDVRKLLTYPDDSAGGIMTTEFVAVRPDLTAEQALALLRETAQEAENIFYVYVTDRQDHLLGVFSLNDLVLAKPETLVTEFMHLRVVSVDLEGQPGRGGAGHFQVQPAGRAGGGRPAADTRHRHRRRRAGQDHSRRPGRSVCRACTD